jgi:hypothetical protein
MNKDVQRNATELSIGVRMAAHVAYLFALFVALFGAALLAVYLLIRTQDIMQIASTRVLRFSMVQIVLFGIVAFGSKVLAAWPNGRRAG